jgi:hypothetical protein
VAAAKKRPANGTPANPGPPPVSPGAAPIAAGQRPPSAGGLCPLPAAYHIAASALIPAPPGSS